MLGLLVTVLLLCLASYVLTLVEGKGSLYLLTQGYSLVVGIVFFLQKVIWISPPHHMAAIQIQAI